MTWDHRSPGVCMLAEIAALHHTRLSRTGKLVLLTPLFQIQLQIHGIQ
jgi:hypothetical protein